MLSDGGGFDRFPVYPYTVQFEDGIKNDLVITTHGSPDASVSRVLLHLKWVSETYVIL